MSHSTITRRRFLMRSAGAAVTGLSVPYFFSSPQARAVSKNDRLNVASIGVSVYRNVWGQAGPFDGRGTVIGQPTFGGVISTGSYELVDGSRVRTPFRGWWVKRGEFRSLDDLPNMERDPCVPDIRVTNAPDDYVHRRDPQLERAVSELLGEIDG